MIEQGIYFALGCIITALAALMFAPLFWRRALRLTRKRLQLQIPLSMQEIRAEHDQLRATFAVERLRVEQAAQKVRETKAADMAEIGRRDVTIADLQARLADAHLVGDSHLQKIASHERDLADQRTEHTNLKTSLDHALSQRDNAHAERDSAMADKTEWQSRAERHAAEIDRLTNAVESHRTTIAGLETRAMGLEMRLTDNERSSAGRLKAAEDGLRSKLEAAMSQSTRHEASAISLQRECEDAKARVRALEHELDTVLERERATHLHGSLAGARADRLEASADRSDKHGVPNGAVADGSDADLRASIHALGLAVAMMSRRTADASSLDRVTKRDVPSPADAN